MPRLALEKKEQHRHGCHAQNQIAAHGREATLQLLGPEQEA
jgi:hypothetical protein